MPFRDGVRLNDLDLVPELHDEETRRMEKGDPDNPPFVSSRCVK